MKHEPLKLSRLWRKKPREISPDQAMTGTLRNLCRHEDRLLAHEYKFIRYRSRLDTRCNELEAHVDEIETDLKIRIDAKNRMNEVWISELRAKNEAQEAKIELLLVRIEQQEKELNALRAHLITAKADEPTAVTTKANEDPPSHEAKGDPNTPQ